MVGRRARTVWLWTHRIRRPPRATDSGTTTDDGVITTPIDAAAGTLLPATAADTYVLGIDTTPNGLDADLKVGRNSGNGNNLYALLQFDLSTITQGTISTVTLRLYQYSSLGIGTMGVEVYRLTQQWDEATASWDEASTGVTWSGGGPVAAQIYAVTSVPLGALGYFDWDVTTLVNEWLAGTTNQGIELRYETQPAAGTYVMFASRQHATAAWRPQLLVTP